MKKKLNIGLTYILLVHTSCWSSTTNSLNQEIQCNTSSMSIAEPKKWSNKLTISKQALQNKIDQEKFFCLFPNEFNEFEALFGYKNIKLSKEELDSLSMEEAMLFAENGKAPLYDSAKSFIHLFFTALDSLPKKSRITKTINIASSGRWDADAVSIFQLYLQEDFEENAETYFKILSKNDISKTLSFWHFYFDGPHPESYINDFKILYERYSEKNERVAKLMKKAFEKLLTESDGHEH